MKLLIHCLAVGIGGFLGALARFGVALLASRAFGSAFPVGTLVINVTGSFALGYFVAWGASRSGVPEAARLAVSVGFLGAYTTFSTFAYESDALARADMPWRAIANVALSVVLGLLALRLGMAAGHR